MHIKLNQIQNWTKLAAEAKWSAANLAKRCGVSERTLRRFFLRLTGKGIKVWMAEQRQTLAVELLSRGSSVKETASCLNYKQQTNFARKFKAQWGIRPSVVRSLVQKTELSANDS